MEQLKFLSLATLGALVAGTGSALAADAVGISTSWEPTLMTESSCLQRAEQAMRNGGFTELEFAGQSIFGDYGNYTASIRCATSKEIIFFLVAGPSSNEASDIRDWLLQNF